MEKVYYTEPYRKSIKCRPEEKTIFYPECGGQPGDRGWADDIKILDTKKADDGSSVYVLENGGTLDNTKEYEFKLDWDHRYKYMVMHACQHMLSGLLFTMFDIGTVAVHLGEDYLTIEVGQEKVEEKVVEELIKAANKKIEEGHKIIYHEMSHSQAEALGLRRSIKVEGDVRIVEIEGVDCIACGGVHASSTSEIRLVLFTGHEQIRGHERLIFKCGQDAVDYALANGKIISEVTGKLSCTAAELLPKFEKLSSELSEAKAKAAVYAAKVAKTVIDQNLKDGVAAFETDLDIQAIVSCASEYTDLALCAFNGNHWCIVLKGKYEKTDFNVIRKDLLSLVGAKGGGRTPVFQGIATDTGAVGKVLSGFCSCLVKD